MSKRTRHADNSKRQQPVQQQRAQARQPGAGGPSKSGGNMNPQQNRKDEADTGSKR